MRNKKLYLMMEKDEIPTILKKIDLKFVLLICWLIWGKYKSYLKNSINDEFMILCADVNVIVCSHISGYCLLCEAWNWDFVLFEIIYLIHMHYT